MNVPEPTTAKLVDKKTAAYEKQQAEVEEESRMKSLEQLAGKDTVVHRLHPAAKLTATAVYILCVASMGRYSFFAMTPYVFYPCIVLALAELPFGMVFRRTLIALPFCLFAGISNLIFDRSVAFWLDGIPITGGMLSVFTILLRALLCVSAVLILVAVTPLSALTGELRCLHVPGQGRRPAARGQGSAPPARPWARRARTP